MNPRDTLIDILKHSTNKLSMLRRWSQDSHPGDMEIFYVHAGKMIEVANEFITMLHSFRDELDEYRMSQIYKQADALTDEHCDEIAAAHERGEI